MSDPQYYRFDSGGDPVSAARPLPVGSTGAFPIGSDGVAATPVKASSGNVANATGTATIPAVAGKTAFISGFDITGSGATAASVVSPTVAGLLGGTATYTLAVVAGVSLPNPVISIKFDPPLPASGVNVAITVSCPALGAGSTNNTVNAYGYYLTR